MNRLFQKFAQRCSNLAGSPTAFMLALLAILVWAIAGPAMQYSETWMLLVNTLTTIVTFLMVFVIQSAQNRETKIARIERQSILRAISDAPNTLIGLERDSDERIEQIEQELEDCRIEADDENS